MGILYTQAQVENAQLRAQVALYIISQNIENGFYYFGNPVYQTYKALQYDIYTLFNIIGNELPFVTFVPIPDLYEYSFYELVGSLINKTKQFDVYGLFGGSINNNYQPPSGVVIGITSGFEPITLNYTQANLVSDGQGGYYLPLVGANGLTVVSVIINGIGQSGFTPNYTVTPATLEGFANNLTQAITIWFI